MDQNQVFENYSEKNAVGSDTRQLKDHLKEQQPFTVSSSYENIQDNNIENSDLCNKRKEIQAKFESAIEDELKFKVSEGELKEANVKVGLEESKYFLKVTEAKVLDNIVEKENCNVEQVEGIKIDDCDYTGPVVNGLPHGKGKLHDWMGGHFEGMWRYGKKEGLHIWKHENKAVYEYNYKDGKEHGYQKQVHSNGRVFEWNYKNGNLHGYLKQVVSNGTAFEWSYKDGKQNGEYKETNSNGSVAFKYYENDELKL